MRSRAFALFAAAGLIAAACGGTAAPSPSPTQAAAASPTVTPAATATPIPTKAPPSVTIFSPQGGIVPTNINAPFVVYVVVRNLKLDGTKIGTAPTEGVGMWHLSIDDKYAGLGVSESISVPNDAFPALAVGEHTLKVSLHNNDHSPVAGTAANTQKINVLTALKFSAGGGAPSVKIASPASGVTRGSANDKRLDVSVTYSGLTFDGSKIGTAPGAGVGHWHVFVDDKYAGLSVSGIVTLPNDAVPELAPGEHTIKVDLHNNDHSPIAGAAASTIKVTIKDAMKYP